MKRNILLDIDGVIANFYKSFATYLNKTYGANLDVLDEPTSYVFTDWDEALADMDVDEAVINWINNDGFLHLDPYVGAEDFVRELMALGNVHIVTARVGDFETRFNEETIQQIKENTQKWFNNHDIPTNGDVIFSHKKVDLCLKEGISILVEDKLSTIIDAAQNDIHAIVMNRAWNRHPDRFKVYRAHSYEDVLEFVRRLSK